MLLSTLRTGAALAALTLAPSAFAALPFGTLSFVEPTGTVGPNDVIDVRMRFTLDMNSSPLLMSPGDLSGFDQADLPTEGGNFDPVTQSFVLRPFAQITGANLNVYFSCNDTFTNGCNGPDRAYTYAWHFEGEPGGPSAIGKDTIALQPGEAFEYLFVTLTPRAGGAPAGSYAYFNTGLTLSFTGSDADGNFIYTNGVDLGSTCSGGGDPLECAFTRTVTAVPEPQTWLLLALGLAAVAPLARRRRG